MIVSISNDCMHVNICKLSSVQKKTILGFRKLPPSETNPEGNRKFHRILFQQLRQSLQKLKAKMSATHCFWCFTKVMWIYLFSKLVRSCCQFDVFSEIRIAIDILMQSWWKSDGKCARQGYIKTAAVGFM